MACIVRVTAVRGWTATTGQDPDRVEVDCRIEITAGNSGCSELEVLIQFRDSASNDFISSTAVLVELENNAGTATFVAGEHWPINVGPECGRELFVTATCVDPKAKCEPATRILIEQLPCPEMRCPTVTASIDMVGACTGEGRRPVTLSAQVSNVGSTDVVVLQFDYGDDPAGPNWSESRSRIGPGTVTFTPHAYAPPTPHTATLRVIYPEPCLGSTVNVGPLDACVVPCPSLEASIARIEDCDANGNRLVVLQAAVSGEQDTSETLVQFNYGDGTFSQTLEIAEGGTAETEPHPYRPPGPYTATLQIVGRLDCLTVNVTVGPLVRCDVWAEREEPDPVIEVVPTCPELTGISVTGCAPGEVRLEARGRDLDTAESFDWNFGNGQSERAGSIVTHEYEERGSFQATVTMKRSSRCDPPVQTRRADVPACRSEFELLPPLLQWCLPTILLILTMMILGAILFPVGFCVMIGTSYTGVGFWVGLVLFVIGAILLTIGAGLLVLWLQNCGTTPDHCWLLELLWEGLLVFSLVSSAVAVVVTILLQWCGLPVAFDAAYFAVLMFITLWFTRAVGCLLYPQWFIWLTSRLGITLP